jgi:hypothetical protein
MNIRVRNGSWAPKLEKISLKIGMTNRTRPTVISIATLKTTAGYISALFTFQEGGKALKDGVQNTAHLAGLYHGHIEFGESLRILLHGVRYGKP